MLGQRKCEGNRSLHSKIRASLTHIIIIISGRGRSEEGDITIITARAQESRHHFAQCRARKHKRLVCLFLFEVVFLEQKGGCVASKRRNIYVAGKNDCKCINAESLHGPKEPTENVEWNSGEKMFCLLWTTTSADGALLL